MTSKVVILMNGWHRRSRRLAAALIMVIARNGAAMYR